MAMLHQIGPYIGSIQSRRRMHKASDKRTSIESLLDTDRNGAEVDLANNMVAGGDGVGDSEVLLAVGAKPDGAFVDGVAVDDGVGEGVDERQTGRGHDRPRQRPRRSPLPSPFVLPRRVTSRSL